jgi:hypothetical protein
VSRPSLVDEHRARAAAGLTLALGAVAFSVAVLDGVTLGIRVVSVLFAIDFLVRVVDRLEHSPTGVVAGWLVGWQRPLPVSARPKRFAWTLGLAMSTTMAVITNLGVRGFVPRLICVTCLVLMWAEATLGLCLGCEIHGVLMRRGLAGRRDGYDVCASGACELPSPSHHDDPISTHPQDETSRWSTEQRDEARSAQPFTDAP